MFKFSDPHLADELARVGNQSRQELLQGIVSKTVEIQKFWSAADNWAPFEAAQLLSRSRLDWQVSLSRCLSIWVGHGSPRESDGRLILAWANLGSLVEGLLKWCLSIFYHSYQADIAAIRKRGKLVDPDGLSLEPLRIFFRDRVWLEEERDDWDRWLLHIQLRRNAIHAFKDRPLGTLDEFHEDTAVYAVLLRALDGRAPYP